MNKPKLKRIAERVDDVERPALRSIEGLAIDDLPDGSIVPAIEVAQLRKTYPGGIEAVKGITLNVGEKEIVTLVGANGAGKSTTLRAISGLLRPAGGSIRFQGERIDGLPAHRIARAGVGHSPEGRRVFARLSVRAHRHRKQRDAANRNLVLFEIIGQASRAPGSQVFGGQ